MGGTSRGYDDMDPLTEISLFSGYGGFALGLRFAGLRVQTACYVEKDAYCQRIIIQRIAEGDLDDAPIWDDATGIEHRADQLRALGNGIVPAVVARFLR